jgi:cytochrome c-type biogenesis protein
MQYFIVFLEGIITFISPCILPMLPIYIAYLAGNLTEGSDWEKRRGLLINATGFVLGFSILFMLLGAAAGSIGKFIALHTSFVNIFAGAVMILFGLNFMEVLKIKALNATKRLSFKGEVTGFLPALLFGFVFGLGWSPCVGAFLGSALALAANSGTAFQGVIMLAIYSAGLGVPFIVSALLLNQLEGAFDFIRKNHKIISFISGLMLVILGILTALGVFNFVVGLLS